MEAKTRKGARLKIKTTMESPSPSGKGLLRVVCAGLGRTGTYSLTTALEILGYKPYHFIDVRHAKQWALLANGDVSVDSVIDLIVGDGYDAVLDDPCCDFYLDTVKRFPDVKVILTVRDSPAVFEKSWKVLMDTTVLTEQPFNWKFPFFFGWIPLFRHARQIRYMMGTTYLHLEPGALTHGWREQEDGWLGTQYERHNQHVQRHVDKNNLLVFNVKDGWKPLCDFLGVDVPPIPFPHVKSNDTRSLLKMKRAFQFIVYSWIPITVGVVMGAPLYGRRVVGTSCRPGTN